jgi:Ca2+-binding EF-hand superfamily protein
MVRASLNFNTANTHLTILGTCEPHEFSKALEKIGIVVGNKKDIETLFNYYDSDKSGSLDYKEFTAIIVGGGV